MFKFLVDSLDTIPQQFHSFYTKREDGKFQLNVEGLPDQKAPQTPPPSDDSRLSEFRTKNIALMKKIQELEAQLGGIDMDVYAQGRRALDQIQSEEDKRLLQAGRFEDVINRHTAKIRDDYEAKLKKAMDDLAKKDETVNKFKQGLRQARVQTDLRDAADQMKIRFIPTATADVYARAMGVLNLDDDGNVVALDEEGNIRMNEERKPFGPKDFLKSLLETAPHLLVGADTPGLNGPRRGPGGALTLDIDAGDPKAFGNNIEAIAKGKINVRTTL